MAPTTRHQAQRQKEEAEKKTARINTLTLVLPPHPPFPIPGRPDVTPEQYFAAQAKNLLWRIQHWAPNTELISRDGMTITYTVPEYEKPEGETIYDLLGDLIREQRIDVWTNVVNLNGKAQ